MEYVIIGGVAGGATVAARLRRMDEEATITLIEKGVHISYANCGLPYYIGDTISDRNALFLQTPTTFGNRFNVDVRVQTEVTAIDRDHKCITCHNLRTGKESTLKYDKLVLSPGSMAVIPNIAGVTLPNIFTLKDVADTDAIKQHIVTMGDSAEKTAVVLGGGFIGLEMVENLSKVGMKVILIEQGEHIMPSLDKEIALELQHHLRDCGVQVLTQHTVVAFEATEAAQTVVVCQEGEKITADFVLLSVGVKPQTALAEGAGLTIGATGGIAVNDYMQTTDPDIYAVGDAVETINPLTQDRQCCFLAGPTNKQARIAADNIALGNHRTYKGSINTAIAKVFDYVIGRTGLSEAEVKRRNLPYQTSITHTASNATYYPGSFPVSIKIQFDPMSGKLWGATLCGTVGVDKRLDLLAHTIADGGTIYQLTEFDHAYAPPFSSAKDAVIVAGYVAENIIKQRVHPIQWHELQRMLKQRGSEDFLLIDVRSVMENRAGTIEGAVNYPLEELREYIEDLPTDKTIVLFCAIGLRGYIASRMLLQSGFERVYNLSGGFKTYETCTR